MGTARYNQNMSKLPGLLSFALASLGFTIDQHTSLLSTTSAPHARMRGTGTPVTDSDGEHGLVYGLATQRSELMFNLDSLNYPWQAGVYPEPIEPDCFAEDCAELGDDEYRYPQGVRRVAPVLYDGDA